MFHPFVADHWYMSVTIWDVPTCFTPNWCIQEQTLQTAIVTNTKSNDTLDLPVLRIVFHLKTFDAPESPLRVDSLDCKQDMNETPHLDTVVFVRVRFFQNSLPPLSSFMIAWIFMQLILSYWVHGAIQSIDSWEGWYAGHLEIKLPSVGLCLTHNYSFWYISIQISFHRSVQLKEVVYTLFHTVCHCDGLFY